LSEDWGKNTNRQPKRGNQNLLFIFVMVISSLLLNTYLINTATNRMNDLSTEIDDLQVELENMAYEMQSLNDQMDDLQVSGGGTVIVDGSGVNLTKIYEAVADSVVLIQVQTAFSAGQGSGFVFDKKGRIITNNHVVEDAETNGITVIFTDGTSAQAEILGTDPYSDLAVIKVNVSKDKLNPVDFAKSSNLMVGQRVIALGNPFGLTNTMTSGIVSALSRQLSAPGNYVIVDVIQTDAAINPGNSGGPLLNINGEVIGMNTAIISSVDQFSGVGFAVPSDTIFREVFELINNGEYLHPWLGITGITLFPALKEKLALSNDQGGLLVTEVTGEPALEAGLEGGTVDEDVGSTSVKIGGDVIIGVDGKNIDDFNDLMVYLERNMRPDETITLRVIRDGSEMDVDLTLGARP